MWLNRLIVVIFLLVISGFLYVVRDPWGFQLTHRNRLRHEHLTQLDVLITQNVVYNGNQPPAGLTTEWQQIGTGKTGCQITNARCQVNHEACLDWQFLTGSPLVTLPSDPSVGYLSRTGYAARLVEPQTIELVSCFAEGEAITNSHDYPGLIYEVMVP